ncbi:MAG TPA: hypothetical protein VF875_02555 [Anaeromyxobacter sp.]
MTDPRPPPPGEFPRGFEGHRRAQAGAGLRLTPAERLRWLEETMDALRRWRGRARKAERGE